MFSPVAEIHLGRLIRNYRKIREQVGDALVMPVVKANGYGHGAVTVANSLQKEGVKFFSVFTFDEAVELRNNGINGDILIFSRMTEDILSSAVDLNITLNIAHKDDITYLNKFVEKTKRCPKVHLKVDTGMTRLGVDFDELPDLVKKIKGISLINLEGIYTHFATSDEGDPAYAELQIQRFNEVVKICEKFHIPVKYYHIANSGGVLNHPDSYFNMVRVGMLMYGAYPSGETTECVDVEPVMNFKGPVVSIRRVKRGTPVSYGSVYAPDRDVNIGVIQTGFADGFPRNWYKQGFVGYKGNEYQIAGRVCMDQFMVNFKDDLPKIGDEVLFFGYNGENRIRIEDIASEIDTTTYVLMTAIGGRTKRVYVNE